MRRLKVGVGILALGVALVSCGRRETSGLEIPNGTDVTIHKKDGVTIAGRLVEVKPQLVVLEDRAGAKTEVPRSEIASVRASAVDSQAPSAPQPPAAPVVSAADRGTLPGARSAASDAARPAGEASTAATAGADAPTTKRVEYREVRIPAGTIMSVELKTTVASDTSRVEDPVRGTLRRGITVNGVEAIPANSVVTGHVTDATRSGRVKGRARVAFRFSQLDMPGDGGRMAIRTGTVARVAQPTKKKDAAKIGGGAAGGAIIGGIVGGGSGAAKGAAIGGGAGTGVVLSTRGDEVRLGPVTPVTVKLLEPLLVRVRVK